MISKRKICELIIEKKGCENITDICCKECYFEVTHCGYYKKETVLFATTWLEEHPKKDRLKITDTDSIGYVTNTPSTLLECCKEPTWLPKIGDVVAIWYDFDKDDTSPVVARREVGWGVERFTGFIPLHQALVDSLDEIGKPISYFKERGKWI